MRRYVIDKETPASLRIDNEGWLCCPRCDDTFSLFDHFGKRNHFCGKCGQALDWSDIHEPSKYNMKHEILKRFVAICKSHAYYPADTYKGRVECKVVDIDDIEMELEKMLEELK